MNIAGTCTVTYIDDTHLLACGHPLLQSGNVDMPMTKATVLATLPSPENSFKIVNTTETGRRIRAGPPRRHHGPLRSRAAHDSGDADLPRRLASQAIPLRSAEQRQDHARGNDGHGLQRHSGHERVRRGHDLSPCKATSPCWAIPKLAVQRHVRARRRLDSHGLWHRALASASTSAASSRIHTRRRRSKASS